MAEIIIRENIPEHISALRAWLENQENVPLEEMGDFFTARISDYEQHMALWREGYEKMAKLLPASAARILDLGCGTGLELDEILRLRPDVEVTGIDLCPAMLQKLRAKHPGVRTICGDYFQEDLGEEQYDCVITFESLHHFLPEKKQRLFEHIHRALKPGGVFLEVDYLAACQEEEDMLMAFAQKKRQEQGIPEDVFVHFDTPLTAEHEMKLLRAAGFPTVNWLCAVEGASFLWCEKGETI